MEQEKYEENGGEIYFRSMRQIVPAIDRFIESEIDRTRILSPKLEEIVRSLPDRRKEKPKMRPNMSYLIYRMYGGNKPISEIIPAIALSEISNIHLYLHNWIFDNKNNALENRERVNLLIASSEIFRDIAQRVIEELNIKEILKREISRNFAQSTIDCYNGQALDFTTTIDELLELNDKEFLKYYEEKARLLSGRMYQFSGTLGAIIADVSKIEIDNSTEFGELFGRNLQISNDLGDFAISPQEITFKNYQDQLSDLVDSRCTWPIYYALKNGNSYEQSAMRAIIGNKNATIEQKKSAARAIVTSGAYQSTIELLNSYLKETKLFLKRFPENKWRNALSSMKENIRKNKFIRAVRDIDK